MSVEIDEIQDRVADYLATRPEIKVGYIFGSRATNKGNKLSDIDIALLIDRALLKGSFPYGYKARILTDLAKILRTDRMDLVILNDAPCLLGHRVIRYGKVLFSRDESERIDFQVSMINKYLDIKRLLLAHQ